jgi:hypothetical protein
MTKQEIQAEAIDRARNGQSVMNYAAIFEGFMAKGIAESDIEPRVNVLTFHAWKAVGRSVKKGEHGVKVVTFIDTTIRDTSEAGEETVRHGRRPHTTTVFHISQTELEGERLARRGDKPAKGRTIIRPASGPVVPEWTAKPAPVATPQVAPMVGMSPLGFKEGDQKRLAKLAKLDPDSLPRSTYVHPSFQSGVHAGGRF